MNDVMIDIETFSSTPGAAIVQIGAVRFDATTGEMDPVTFSINVSLNSCLAAGLTISEQNIKWWMLQDDQARKLLFEPTPVSLASALNGLTRFLSKEDSIWCHSVFDIPCLEVAYHAANIKTPWRYSKIVDLRTYFRDRKFNPTTDMPVTDTDVYHNALSDCIRQIRDVHAAYTKAGF